MKSLSLIILATALATAALTGCAERHSVQYYAKHTHADVHEAKWCLHHGADGLSGTTLHNCRAAVTVWDDTAPPIPVD